MTVAEIIKLWPTAVAFGDDIGLKYRGDHARQMAVRKRIPRTHWPRVLEAARRRRLKLTERDLEEANRKAKA